jgi:hypothetical protein
MKSNKNISFTIVHHAARIKLGLSLNDYCVADTIYHLSHNSANDLGWCYKSKENMGRDLGLSKQTLHKIINKLIEKGLVEKNEAGQLRTTANWWTAVIEMSQKSRLGVKSDGEQLETLSTRDSTKGLHYNYINKDSDTDFAVAKRIPLSIKTDRQTLVVLQRWEDVYKAEYQDLPVFGLKEVSCVKNALKQISERDALELIEDWFNSSRVTSENRPLVTFAFSNISITRWKACEL